MGLVSGLLTLPIAPLRGVGWVLERVLDETEREYYDPAPVEHELAELEKELLAGRVSEEEFDRREDELLDRLEALRPPLAQPMPAAPPGDAPRGSAQPDAGESGGTLRPRRGPPPA